MWWSRKFTALACIVTAVTALALPMSAGAGTSPTADGTLYFSRATAQLVGKTALVPVRCVGTQGSSCSGTLSLTAGAAITEAPFSVTTGGNRIVDIPLGSVHPSGSTAVAEARTARAYGGYSTATEVLRLR